ncbi:YopX family protein, partial [Bacillus cereus group sp. MYBK77-1]
DNGTAAVPLWNEMHILEIVGNIYENPELLKNITK